MASFRKRNGKWGFRVSYKDPFTQQYRNKNKSGFDTKKEAQLAAAEFEKQLNVDSLRENAPIMLKHFLEEWLTVYKKNNVSKNTYNSYINSIKNHILPHFKDITIQQISPGVYQKFINHLIEKKYSRRSIEIIHSTMSNCLKKAVELNKITKNPCKNVEMPFEKRERNKKVNHLELDEVRLLLKTLYQDEYNYYIFFYFLVHTGLRKGEAAALQWNDIDLKERIIHVNKTLDFDADSVDELFGETKTFSSVREVTISDELAQELLKYKKMQNDHKLMLNDIYHHELNLVFCKNDGSHLPRSTLYRKFANALKKAELPKIAIHDLRHTHATLLLQSGASMKFIQERLGHGSMNVTANVYTHVSKGLKEETLERFENLMKTTKNF